jgi:hypothetical protein
VKGVIAALTLFGVTITAAHAAATTTYTATATSACLSAHKLLVNPLPRSQAVPAHVPAVSALSFSFALIPGQALDHGEIVFERDTATAARAWKTLFSMSVAEAAQVQGISMAKATAQIRQSLGLHGNTITMWANHPVKTASRTRVVACLR